jgi:hypothetical protein
MKSIFIIILLTLAITCYSQRPIEKTVPVSTGQKLTLDFEYPQLIRVQTWDKKEVRIKGTVSINRGEHDNAFELQVNSLEQAVTIASFVRDKDKIPQRMLIKRGDREYYFKTDNYNDPEVQKFLQEHGEIGYMSNGIIQEIELEVFVPENVETVINAKFGLVEVVKFRGPLTVNAIHGGVDVSIATPAIGELVARTEFGEILTNLDIKFNSTMPEGHRNNWTIISAKPGTGPKYDLESKFGKVYLRKMIN